MRSRTANWFECKIRYEKVMEDGLQKKVNESYVVDALSFSEAEERIMEEMSSYISGEFDVADIKKATYKEIFFSDDDNADKWYKAKLQFITIDEKTDKEKRSSVSYLVQAGSFNGAVKNIDEVMGGTMIDYVISSVAETTLMDVFEYKKAARQNDQPMAAYEEGQRLFGESHEQELRLKHESLPKDIEWHFIGHLQTNKVKYIAPYVSMVEAVDSLKLLREINKQAARCNRVIKVLLELHIAEESTKYGLTLEACREILDDGEWRQMKNVRICGLMMMASNVDDTEQIRGEMQTAATFFDEVKAKYFVEDDAFCERSWGMSDDYQIALNIYLRSSRLLK